MINIERVCISGWWAAIRGARNALNSWDRSDSIFRLDDGPVGIDILGAPVELSGEIDWMAGPFEKLIIGPNDLDLMMRLSRGGGDEAKYRRFIDISFDVTAPLYWWKQADTYRVGVAEVPTDIESNSCSTMHKIHAKALTTADFSCEYLYSDELECLENTIKTINSDRELYLDGKRKADWMQMIQLLPDSYNQKRTIQMNYQVLAGIYPKRKWHKLSEWVDFCKWIETLPYSQLITLEEG